MANHAVCNNEKTLSVNIEIVTAAHIFARNRQKMFFDAPSPKAALGLTASVNSVPRLGYTGRQHTGGSGFFCPAGVFCAKIRTRTTIFLWWDWFSAALGQRSGEGSTRQPDRARRSGVSW